MDVALSKNGARLLRVFFTLVVVFLYATIAAVSSAGAVVLGVLASMALTRRFFRGKAAVSALLLSPLVIPYVVFGISLLLLFHTLGVPRSLVTVVIGHIVISLPYTILVLVPRL